MTVSKSRAVSPVALKLMPMALSALAFPMNALPSDPAAVVTSCPVTVA